jgi:hypothetical protein
LRRFRVFPGLSFSFIKIIRNLREIIISVGQSPLLKSQARANPDSRPPKHGPFGERASPLRRCKPVSRRPSIRAETGAFAQSDSEVIHRRKSSFSCAFIARLHIYSRRWITPARLSNPASQDFVELANRRKPLRGEESACSYYGQMH